MRLYVDVYVQHIHQHRGIEVRVYVDVYVQHIHQHGHGLIVSELQPGGWEIFLIFFGFSLFLLRFFQKKRFFRFFLVFLYFYCDFLDFLHFGEPPRAKITYIKQWI